MAVTYRRGRLDRGGRRRRRVPGERQIYNERGERKERFEEGGMEEDNSYVYMCCYPKVLDCVYPRKT